MQSIQLPPEWLIPEEVVDKKVAVPLNRHNLKGGRQEVREVWVVTAISWVHIAIKAAL